MTWCGCWEPFSARSTHALNLRATTPALWVSYFQKNTDTEHIIVIMEYEVKWSSWSQLHVICVISPSRNHKHPSASLSLGACIHIYHSWIWLMTVPITSGENLFQTQKIWVALRLDTPRSKNRLKAHYWSITSLQVHEVSHYFLRFSHFELIYSQVI